MNNSEDPVNWINRVPETYAIPEADLAIWDGIDDSDAVVMTKSSIMLLQSAIEHLCTACVSAGTIGMGGEGSLEAKWIALGQIGTAAMEARNAMRQSVHAIIANRRSSSSEDNGA